MFVKILARLSFIFKAVVTVIFLAARGMAGAGGADRAYDLDAGYGNPKAKCRCRSRDSGKFPVYEAGAGSCITDHVSVLDLDASGGGIHAVTS